MDNIFLMCVSNVISPAGGWKLLKPANNSFRNLTFMLIKYSASNCKNISINHNNWTLLCPKSDCIPQMEILRITFSAEREYKTCCVAVMWVSGELEGTGNGSGTSPHQDYSGCLCSVSASNPISHPRAGALNASTDKVHNAHTVCYSNPTEPESKETWCAHLLVIELYALACVPTKEPSSVYWEWWTREKQGFFFPKFINGEQWQVASANMKFLM